MSLFSLKHLFFKGLQKRKNGFNISIITLSKSFHAQMHLFGSIVRTDVVKHLNGFRLFGRFKVEGNV